MFDIRTELPKETKVVDVERRRSMAEVMEGVEEVQRRIKSGRGTPDDTAVLVNQRGSGNEVPRGLEVSTIKVRKNKKKNNKERRTESHTKLL